jgi:hypothetical protein
MEEVPTMCHAEMVEERDEISRREREKDDVIRTDDVIGSLFGLLLTTTAWTRSPCWIRGDMTVWIGREGHLR